MLVVAIIYGLVMGTAIAMSMSGYTGIASMLAWAAQLLFIAFLVVFAILRVLGRWPPFFSKR